MKKIYPWRRFWVRENTEVLLDDDAYLYDPEGEFGQFLKTDATTFAEISNEPCAILLGEPGMGKSSSLRKDFEELITTWAPNNDVGVLIDLGAVTSITDLQGELLANTVVRSWIAGSGILHLCLDSLDEGLPQYAGLPKALMQVINKFPLDRMRLAIACRTGEFPPYLQNELISDFGNNRVCAWHMAPLRRKDVHMAAAENGLDGDQFLTAVSESAVQPLARMPVSS